MAINPNYMAPLSLQQYFVDKETGEPLANGVVRFYKDLDRLIPKEVFELSGSPPNYTYSSLGSTLTLGATGTFVDVDGNDIQVFYYPYSISTGDVENYYITVEDSLGQPQFTREAFPYVPADESSGMQDPARNLAPNMLTNPQFADVFFDPANGMTLNYTGSTTTTFPFAPGWALEIEHSGAGSVTLSRTSVSGTLGYPTNPSYVLGVTAGANITNMYLRQRLENTPSIWTELDDISNDDTGGFLASSATVSTGTQLIMYYRDSNGTIETILNETNDSGVIAELRETVQLSPSTNPDTSDTGYVDILVQIPTTGTTTITSLQVIGMSDNISNVPYVQAPVARQKDQTFNYYQLLLRDKPIPSALVGWDFPLNPAQWGSTYSVAGIGANKSDYVWDQTIVFQSQDDGFTASRAAATEALRLTVALDDTELAVIQYIEEETAKDLLTGRMAVHIAANKVAGADRVAKINLYYTTDAMLPDMGANNSLVASIDGSDNPVVTNGSWNLIPRSNYGDAEFTLTTNANVNFNEQMFNGWDMEGAADIANATYMAIVVSVENMSNTESFDIQSISLCKGDIATRPAPQSKDAVLSACERYYEQNFEAGEDPTVANEDNQMLLAQSSYNDLSTGIYFQNAGFGFRFCSEKYFVPDMLYYSTNNGTLGSVTAHLWDTGSAALSSADAVLATSWATTSIDTKGVSYTINATLNAPNSGGFSNPSMGSGWITFHYVADSRLGIVNV